MRTIAGGGGVKEPSFKVSSIKKLEVPSGGSLYVGDYRMVAAAVSSNRYQVLFPDYGFYIDVDYNNGSILSSSQFNKNHYNQNTKTLTWQYGDQSPMYGFT